ncbi:saccharopine dehydrogenase [Nocardia jiangsuensis]|uniref:Saccharopine dehydrogenase n=1 Tax=Nocardia jiangsuensis TaxID=1691563 RepID=A0ABV8DVY2_9NOCA
MNPTNPVLLLGGSGQAGATAAALLRRWHPTLPLTIAARDLARAQRVADELGTATAVTVDLHRADLGLHGGTHSAVVAALWDDRLHGLRHAQRHNLPYLSISSGLTDIAPEVVLSGQRAGAAPVLVASHCFAGTLTLAALHAAREFGRIETVRLGAVLDETDTGGPAGAVDMERLAAAPDAGYVRRDGVFTWITGSDADATVRGIDGTELPGRSLAFLDVPSIALATGAHDVRFDLAVGESASRRRGEPASTEVRIDIDGTSSTGESLATTHYLVHPEGQRPLTALGVALGVERLLGLRGTAAAPGIHTPEGLVDPAYAAERLAEIGAWLTRTA